VEIHLHFVRDRVALGEARVLHVPSSSQFADIFTKGPPTCVFQDFRTSLNITASVVPTAGLLKHTLYLVLVLPFHLYSAALV
jgi:hypothetical protein